MKKLIALGIAVLIVAIAGSAWALDDTDTVDASVSVGETFALSVSGGPVSFGTDLVAGTSAPNQAITANVKTNRDIAWYLKVHASTALLTHTDGVTTMPSFQYWTDGSGSGAGTKVTATDMTTTPATAYTCDASETVLPADTGLDQIINLAIGSIPQDQKTGSYDSVVTITLTE